MDLVVVATSHFDKYLALKNEFEGIVDVKHLPIIYTNSSLR